ncbi:MAG: shikimate kinase [Candidatus Caldarchaeum sp.]|nr:shikimate kinase [Candidatus Caldarchaeum sp.]MDW7978290.1 shikimate kinase [Candidatus Caldarchaeum sp.]
MKGFGKAYGAVSIVNAISTGCGAALGVMLKTEASVEFIQEPKFTLEINGEPHDPALAAEVVKAFAKHFGVDVVGCRVSTTSEIPMAVGLKSSSSAAVAIGKAFLNASKKTMDGEEFLRLVAEASIRSGTSITGAMDDAAACMLGGAVVTDNLERKILLHEKMVEDLMAVILIPPGKMPTRDFPREKLEPVKELVEIAFRLAERSEYWKAMTLNGLLHSAALGLPTAPAMEALRAGAYAAGLSGTGPAVAAVCPPESMDSVERAFQRFEGKVIRCPVNKGLE